MRRPLLVALTWLVIGVLTGCSPTVDRTSATQSASTANEADIRFCQQMIPHHQQSIQIAELAAQHGASDFVKTSAVEIATKETTEVETMSGWLRSWNSAVPSAAGHGGHAMTGMLSAEEIASLENTTGQDFDRRWLAVMAKHLGNGVQMAATALASGQDPQTKALAQDIVTEQGAKIAAINNELSR